VTQIFHALTAIPLWVWIALVVVLGVGLIGLAIRRYLHIRSALVDAQDRPSSSGNRFIEAIVAAQATGWEGSPRLMARFGGRTPTLEPIAGVVDRCVEEEIDRSDSFHLGGLITGFGLFLTFVLVGVLLVQLRDTMGAQLADTTGAPTDPAKLTENIRATVAQIGNKFFVSAAAVFFGVVHMGLAATWKRRLRAAAADLGRALEGTHVSVASFESMHRFDAAERLVEAVDRQTARYEEGAQVYGLKLGELGVQLDAIRDELRRGYAGQGEAELAQLAELQMIQESMRALAQSTESLKSIQVSVQDMGEVVQQNLRDILKESFGEQLATLLAEQKQHLEFIAEKIQKAVSEELSRALEGLIEVLRDRLTKGLEDIRIAIEAKGESNLGSILERLEGMVGQKLRGESDQLKQSLLQMGEVLPKLEATFGRLEAQMGEQLVRQGELRAESERAFLEQAQRTAEQGRAQASEEMRHLRGALEGMRTGFLELVERMSADRAATEASFERIAERQGEDLEASSRRLAAETERTVGQAIAAVDERSSAIVARLESHSAAQMEGLARLLEGLAQSIEQLSAANVTLGETAQRARAVSAETRPVLDSSQRILEGASAAVRGFTAAQGELTKASAEYQRWGEQASKSLSALSTTTGLQREINSKLQELYPEFMEKFAVRIAELAESLTKRSQEVLREAGDRQIKYAERLQESVDNFASVVEDVLPKIVGEAAGTEARAAPAVASSPPRRVAEVPVPPKAAPAIPAQAKVSIPLPPVPTPASSPQATSAPAPARELTDALSASLKLALARKRAVATKWTTFDTMHAQGVPVERLEAWATEMPDPLVYILNSLSAKDWKLIDLTPNELHRNLGIAPSIFVIMFGDWKRNKSLSAFANEWSRSRKLR
jgi:hypothetical protein